MCVHVHTHIYMYAHIHTYTHLVECLELFADFLSMTIAPLGQHTYDGCLIRALCVVVRWERKGVGGRCVEGGSLTGNLVNGWQIACS